MIQFPNINPEIFSVTILEFEFALRWYSLSYILGFICALLIMKFFLKRDFYWAKSTSPMNVAEADNLLTYLILGVIIGGRVGYVLFYNLDYYLLNPTAILRLWDGGMAFHGGFIGVVFAVLIYTQIKKIVVLSIADLIALSTPPGLLLGRVANFINAELWGRPTEKPWGVVFPGERAQTCPGVLGDCARHPSQLYEAALEGLFLFLFLVILAKFGGLRKPGLITGSFIALYGIFRFIIEYFRIPDPQFISEQNPQGYFLGDGQFGITMGQTLSTPMILVGFLLVVWSLFSGSKIVKGKV